ncbi:MAG: hypothetical protein QOE09_2200 [Ilumatobacteraceae bacterium]|jgi:hypothetical protein
MTARWSVVLEDEPMRASGESQIEGMQRRFRAEMTQLSAQRAVRAAVAPKKAIGSAAQRPSPGRSGPKVPAIAPKPPKALTAAQRASVNAKLQARRIPKPTLSIISWITDGRSI